MRRLGLLVGAAAVALVLGVGTVSVIVHAQTATPSQGASSLADYVGQVWDAVASKLGVARSDLDKAMSEARDEVAAKAVKEGAITQEQADRMKSAPPGAFGFGKMGRRGGHMEFGGPGDCLGRAADLAQMLGMTTDELAAELKAGKTVADIAKEKGVDLEAARLEKAKADIAQQVRDGKITQEQADWILKGIEQGYMKGGPGGHMGFGGRMGRGCAMGPGGCLGQSESTQPETQVVPEGESGL